MSYNPVNPNGQTTKANSSPVTIASDQNIALETGGNLASIFTNTNSLNNTVGTLSAGTAATKSLAVGGVYNSSTPTPTTGQQLSLQLDGSGNLKIRPEPLRLTLEHLVLPLQLPVKQMVVKRRK